MELNATLEKIREMLAERNWSVYKLAKESGIPYSSLNSLFQKNNQPTISTLEKICSGFHITMEEFFSDAIPYRDENSYFTADEIGIIEIYRSLNPHAQKVFKAYIKGFAQMPY